MLVDSLGTTGVDSDWEIDSLVLALTDSEADELADCDSTTGKPASLRYASRLARASLVSSATVATAACFWAARLASQSFWSTRSAMITLLPVRRA